MLTLGSNVIEVEVLVIGIGVPFRVLPGPWSGPVPDLMAEGA
jgi:hypothetical protein